MREILFRGKRLDNGEWVEGYIVPYSLNTYKTGIEIIEPDGINYDELDNYYPLFSSNQVDPETVCQFTGLTDKNGVKIFEGDILKGFQYPFLCEGHFNYFAEVLWYECDSSFGTYTFKNPESEVRGISEGNTDGFEGWTSEDWEVIGNIFDNSVSTGIL